MGRFGGFSTATASASKKAVAPTSRIDLTSPRRGRRGRTIERLRSAGVSIEEFPQSSPRLTEASQNLYELLKSGNIVLYPDADIRLAISRAVAKETARGWRIGKEKQTHKIDIIIALAMAALVAAQQGAAPPPDWYLGSGWGGKPSSFTELFGADKNPNPQSPPCTIPLQAPAPETVRRWAEHAAYLQRKADEEQAHRSKFAIFR